MIVAEPTVIQLNASAPEVRLLDARAAGLDEDQLRAWARDQAEASGAAHTSRSYRYPYALVACHEHRVGIDIERVEPLDAAFLESICMPEEHGLGLGVADASSLWCSKEALAKALGDALSYDPRRLGSPMMWPDGRSGPWQAAALRAPAGHNAWVCWESPSARDSA
jgi:4'-phosphopantetheinyl transferase superfamily